MCVESCDQRKTFATLAGSIASDAGASEYIFGWCRGSSKFAIVF